MTDIRVPDVPGAHMRSEIDEQPARWSELLDRQRDAIVLADEAGGKARITKGDVKASNGVIQYVDGVLTPKGDASQSAGAEAQNSAG